MGGSSSRRRKKRSNHAPRRVFSTTARTLHFEHLQISSGKGFDLLCKSGWQPLSPTTPPPDAGLPLDNLISHRSSPIPITVKQGRGGIGAPIRQMSVPETSSAPSPSTIMRGLADMQIFDPLRPTCQYDPSHVVANLKALHKHELTCPSNPRPKLGRRASVPVFAPVQNAMSPLSSSLPTHLSNQFQALMDAPTVHTDDCDSECDSWSSISCSDTEEGEVFEELDTTDGDDDMAVSN